MVKDQVPDYGDFPVTKLPSGKAQGCDDLSKWACNRSVGRAGVSEGKIGKLVRCPKCRSNALVMATRKATTFPYHKCKRCGWKAVNLPLRGPKKGL